MVCIYCGGSTQVNNSRHQKRVNQVWRRRTCLQCRQVATTHEIVDLGNGISVMHNDRLQPFSRDLLFVSVYESCKHRPTALEDATALTQTIISLLVRQHVKNGTLQRSAIVMTSSEALQRFDGDAATIYRAYHQA